MSTSLHPQSERLDNVSPLNEGIETDYVIHSCASVAAFCSFDNLYSSTLQALNWVFVVDTLNFSFWPEEESQQCEVTYEGTTYTGYMTLCAAITRAMKEGESIIHTS